MAPVRITNSSSVHEPKPEMYTILFKQELVDLILTGQKIKTYRYGIKYDYLKVGDEVDIQNSHSKEIACKATITDKYRTTFKELPINIPGHEPYESKDDQRQTFSGYYAYIGREIVNDDPFLVLEFQIKD